MKFIQKLLKRWAVVGGLLLLLASCSKDTVPDQAIKTDQVAGIEETAEADQTQVQGDTADTSADKVAIEETADESVIAEDSSIYVEQQVPDVYKNEIAVAYQIFPIAFADSDGNGTGDLKGITEKLDYLKSDLHVDMIWLNPIHPSPSYHKYDVTDYYGIDPTFGTLDDYKQLIEEAHKRNIKVVLDFVMNHTSSAHPWFMSAKSDPNSSYHDFYEWNTLTEDTFVSTKSWYDVSGSDEKYFASFWSEMPELNFENKEVRDEIKKIAAYWLDLGVDGFRIDAAKHIYDINEYPKGTNVLGKNLDWFLEFNQFIKEKKQDSFLVLENWDSYNSIGSYLKSSDSTFNFDLSTAILSAVNSENRKNIQGKLTKILESYNKYTDAFVDSVILANHDQDRTLSQLGGNINKAKLAASIEFTLPGISWIYYGEEIGMLGKKPDERIRESMKWTDDPMELPNSRWETWVANELTPSVEDQRSDESSILKTYQTLTQLKSSDKVLRHGSYLDYSIGTSFRLFSFFRQYGAETYFVIHNLHSEVKKVKLSSTDTALVFSTNNSAVENDTLTVEPYGTLVIRVPNEAVTAEEIKE